MVTIKKKSLVARINRHLPPFHKLRRARGQRSKQGVEVGDYWIHDQKNNITLKTDIDVENYARKNDLLKPHEQVID